MRTTAGQHKHPTESDLGAPAPSLQRQAAAYPAHERLFQARQVVHCVPANLARHIVREAPRAPPEAALLAI